MQTGKSSTKVSILNEFFILPFCKKMIELLWEKFSSMKSISLHGKIRRNEGSDQITFIVK